MDRALVSRSIQGLVERGLVQALRDERDRRVVFADITSAGGRVYHDVLPQMQARQAALLQVLTPDERRLMYGAIGKLVACLDETRTDHANGRPPL